MDINKIKPYSLNAKKHDKKQIKQVADSIKRFGFVQPIVIDKNNEVVIGHCRLEAAKLLGLTEVPTVSVENLSDKEVKALRLADNKLNESAWDMNLVIDELKGLDTDLLDLTGFDRDLIIEGNEQDDVIPENAPPVAKLGDIWALGSHRVMCGDSTNKEDVEKLMDGKKADMVFTDPPYNVDYGGEQSPIWKQNIKKIKNDNLTPEGWKSFCEKIALIINEFTKGVIYICHAPNGDGRIMAMYLDNVFHWSASIIWKKDRLIPGRAHFQRTYEPIWYGWVKEGEHNNQDDRTETDVWEEMKNIKSSFDGEYTTIKFQGYQVKIKGKAEGFIKRKRQKIDFWQFDRPFKNDLHPTMKPVALVENAIINSSKNNNIILDLFLGSGSTLIACEKTNRICYGMELDEKYCDVIIARWEQYTGLKAELLK